MPLNDPEYVLSKGEYLGFQWEVTHNGHGYRCGYVCIPTGHPWYDEDLKEIQVEVHGGLTFARSTSDGWWIGFDCAHSFDARDWDLPMRNKELARKIFEGLPTFDGEHIRTTEYVEAECRSLCEQAVKADPFRAFIASEIEKFVN